MPAKTLAFLQLPNRETLEGNTHLCSSDERHEGGDALTHASQASVHVATRSASVDDPRALQHVQHVVQTPPRMV